MRNADVIRETIRGLRGRFSRAMVVEALGPDCKIVPNVVHSYLNYWVKINWLRSPARGRFVKAPRFGIPRHRNKRFNRWKNIQRCRQRRRRFQALGLNCNGQPRQRKSWPNLKRFHGKQRQLFRERMRRRQNVEAGLTVDGKHRKRICRAWPELRGLSTREKQRIRARYYRSLNYARGLNSQGKERTNNWRKFPVSKCKLAPVLQPSELAWRQFRASLDIRVPELLSDLQREEAA